MTCDDMKAALMGLIYDDCDPREREEAEDHLRSCAACRREREELEGVCAHIRRHTGEPAAAMMVPGGTAVARAARRRPGRAVLAAALAACALIALAGVNTRFSRDGSGWSVQMSLLPPRVAPAEATPPRQAPVPAMASLDPSLRRQIDALLEARLEEERRRTLDQVGALVRESQERTAQDLSVALASQEQALMNRFHSDSREMQARDLAFERAMGRELTNTRQMLGAVLAASAPRVIEQ